MYSYNYVEKTKKRSSIAPRGKKNIYIPALPKEYNESRRERIHASEDTPHSCNVIQGMFKFSYTIKQDMGVVSDVEYVRVKSNYLIGKTEGKHTVADCAKSLFFLKGVDYPLPFFVNRLENIISTYINLPGNGLIEMGLVDSPLVLHWEELIQLLGHGVEQLKSIDAGNIDKIRSTLISLFQNLEDLIDLNPLVNLKADDNQDCGEKEAVKKARTYLAVKQGAVDPEYLASESEKGAEESYLSDQKRETLNKLYAIRNQEKGWESLAQEMIDSGSITDSVVEELKTQQPDEQRVLIIADKAFKRLMKNKMQMIKLSITKRKAAVLARTMFVNGENSDMMEPGFNENMEILFDESTLDLINNCQTIYELFKYFPWLSMQYMIDNSKLEIEAVNFEEIDQEAKRVVVPIIKTLYQQYWCDMFNHAAVPIMMGGANREAGGNGETDF